MIEEMIIAILIFCVFTVIILWANAIKSVNSDVRKDLSNIKKHLAKDVEWKEITKNSLVGQFQKYKISIELVPFNYLYHSYHITLYGSFKRQPIFMFSYPKPRENIEQRGNKLFTTLATSNIKTESSIYTQVHEILESMASLANELENNA